MSKMTMATGPTHPVCVFLDWTPVSEANRRDHNIAKWKRGKAGKAALAEALAQVERPAWLNRAVEAAKGQGGPESPSP